MPDVSDNRIVTLKSWLLPLRVGPPRLFNPDSGELTVFSDGGVLVTYGVGTKNVGLHYNYSADDGVTWNNDRTVSVLPTLPITARYYSARTVQVDRDTVGTVYMNGSGVHFLRVAIERVKK